KVVGTNDDPTAEAGTAASNEDSIITGSVHATDIDGNAHLTSSSDAPVAGLSFGEDGIFSFDASNAAYQHLAEGKTVDVTANYTATDEHGAVSKSTLTITLTG